MTLEHHQLRLEAASLEEHLVIAIPAQLDASGVPVQRAAIDVDADFARHAVAGDALLRRTAERERGECDRNDEAAQKRHGDRVYRTSRTAPGCGSVAAPCAILTAGERRMRSG